MGPQKTTESIPMKMVADAEDRACRAAAKSSERSTADAASRCDADDEIISGLLFAGPIGMIFAEHWHLLGDD